MNSIKVIRFSKKRQECSVKLKRISNEQIQKWTQCKDSSVIIQKLPEKLAKLAKKQTLGSFKHEEKEIFNLVLRFLLSLKSATNIYYRFLELPFKATDIVLDFNVIVFQPSVINIL